MSGLPSSQTYAYDGVGRLTQVADTTVGGSCLTRSYSYDLDSNRAWAKSFPTAADNTCQTASGATTTTHTYDAADRLLAAGTDAGLVHDAFGRITTLPAADAGGSQVSGSYFVNDLVNTQVQGSRTKTWSVDAALRLRKVTDTAINAGAAKTSHFGDAGTDSPSWIDEGDGTTSRYVPGLDGALGVTVSGASGSPTLTYSLHNLHGDVVTTATSGATTPDGPVLDADEFGNTKPGSSNARYGWLGGKQRSTDTLGGLTLMGVRLYNPVLGRFLQTDPVPGGSANDYDYVNQDPINNFDLDGRWCGLRCRAKKAMHWASNHKMDILGTALTFVPVVGEAAMLYRGYRAAEYGYKVYRLARTERFAAAVGRSRAFGYSSRLFGRAFQGQGRRGILNHGPVRMGWGWFHDIDRRVFRVGVGSRHLDLF